MDVPSETTILVRPCQANDIEALYQAARASSNEVSPWMPWCHPNYSLQDSTGWVLLQEELWKSGEEYNFVISHAVTADFLGVAGLNRIDKVNRFANLTYWVGTSSAGRGIATQAAYFVARFGLLELGLQRIEIVAAVENVVSQRVAEKTGAKHEGTLRKRLVLHGQSHDAVIYSLVAEDLETT